MRILIEPGGYFCRNMGDLGMLQVAVSRLEQKWPDAEIVTFSAAPERLRRFLPRVCTYSPEEREQILAAHRVHRMPWSTRIGLRLGRVLNLTEPRNWKRIPNAIQRFRAGRNPRGTALGRRGNQDWRRVLHSFSLVVASGTGGLCDPFLGHAWSVLELLEAAVSADVPTVMFSQGLGPIDNPILRSKARAVLPRVDLIAVREFRKGPTLLRELGVPEERVHVTGDDAIELADRQCRARLGQSLGVNLRLAGYSNVDRTLASSLAKTVMQFGSAHGLEILPIPISFHDGEADFDAVTSTLGMPNCIRCADEPAAVARAAGLCRVVVAGSYHAAVFALSQGIPVVALSNSLYYEDKFLGLAGMFGRGCRLIRAGDAGAPEKLGSALEELLAAGPGLRERLLRSASDQIARSQAAYQRVFEMVASRHPRSACADLPSPLTVLSPAYRSSAALKI